MVNPDSRPRTILGWPIRWVAGLLCLLTIAAGAIPAYATKFDPKPDANPDDVLVGDLHEGLNRLDGHWFSDEFLGSSATTFEAEIAKEETEASPSTGAFLQDFSRATIRAHRRDDRSQRPIDISGRLFSRAPPRD